MKKLTLILLIMAFVLSGSGRVLCDEDSMLRPQLLFQTQRKKALHQRLLKALKAGGRQEELILIAFLVFRYYKDLVDEEGKLEFRDET